MNSRFQRTEENFSAGKRLSDTEKAEVQINTCGTKKGLRDRQRKVERQGKD